MVEFYDCCNKCNSRLVIEICTTDPRGYAFVRPFLLSTSKNRLPHDVSFHIAHGKRWTDIIVYNQSWDIIFYSQKVIDILRRYMDMTDKCYPIHIEGTNQLYYVIYNLKEYPFINQKMRSLLRKKPYFELPKEYPALFTLTHSKFVLCTKAVKEALTKEKITNIDYIFVYGLTQEEKAIYEATEAIEERAAYEKLMSEE